MTGLTNHKRSLFSAAKTVVVLLLLLFTTLYSAAQAPSAANQIKAVFLYNFTQFVNWPPASLGNGNSPFVIGVLGTDPFGSYLETVVEGERVEGHPIVVQRFSDAKEVRNCHILFINKSNAAEIAKNLNDAGMLTVSDAENFATSGGMIRFYLENNKIRFQINTKAARAANLTISSKLLRLASVLDNQP